MFRFYLKGARGMIEIGKAGEMIMVRGRRDYILKLYDTELVRFSAEGNHFGRLTAEIDYVNEAEMPLFPIPLNEEITPESILSWLESRTIPKHREFVKEILATADLALGDTLGIIDVCKGLSVNDSFWIDQVGREQSFAEVNLFDNELDDTLALVAYTGFTSSQRHKLGLSTEWTTSGQFAKAWRRIGDYLLLYKAGSEGFANAGMEPYSEYFAAQLAKAMGVNAITYDLDKWHGKLASVCPLINDKDTALVPFYAATGQSTFPLNLAICAAVSDEMLDELRSMIVFDAMLCNVDRHAGNYGFLRDNRTGEIKTLAPLFDHNLSLFSRDMECDFKDWPTRADTVMTPRTGKLSFKEECAVVMGEKQHEQLRKAVGFKFRNHPQYPIPENRLNALNNYISGRCSELLGIPVVDETCLREDLDVELHTIKEPIPLLNAWKRR